MQEFNKFYFKSFEFDKENLKAIFNYSFDNKEYFEETIDFKTTEFLIRKDFDLETLNNILFHLHIALGISYYKLFPTKELIVESGFLDEYQTIFWKNFYVNGLGEFLFRNDISPEKLFNFINGSDIKYTKKNFVTSNKSLVPIGGGKDSIVTIELLKKSEIGFDLFVFGKKDELKELTSDLSGKKILLVKRQLSTNLFKLNKEGYYNGHVPITGIIAFVMEVVSYLYDYKNLILSNEKSANFGNTQWKGLNINHQYSKSLEFEKDFKEYIEKYVSNDTKYFSLLRGMYEVKIVELFAKFGKKYFDFFSSCNNNFKIIESDKKHRHTYCSMDKTEEGILGNYNNYWCNNCPKCAFTFSLLRPYLKKEEMLSIFGEDLFVSKKLEKIFRELLGISGIKPFECVGEQEEVIYSMYLTIKNHYFNSSIEEKKLNSGNSSDFTYLLNENKLPYILDIFYKEIFKKLNFKEIKKIEKKLVTIYEEDIIPEEFKKLIFKNI